MTLTIVATAGSASANSFVTEVEVIAYMATRLNATAWTTVTGSTCTETEKAALIEATRELSARRWIGDRASATQSLAWPRSFALDPDTTTVETYYDDATIPQRVKDGTCELAFQFLKAGTSDVAALDPSISVIRKTIGPLTTEYAAPYLRAQGLARYPSVMRFVKPLLVGSGSSVEVIRG